MCMGGFGGRWWDCGMTYSDFRRPGVGAGVAIGLPESGR